MRRHWLIPCALLALVAPQSSHALLEVCTVSTSPVVFGSYNPISGAAVDSTGTVTVTCTAVVSISVNYSIALGTGLGGSFAPRRMTSGANTLPYNLYTSASRSTVWGDGSGGTSTVSDGYTLGLLLVTRNYTVYGRIPASQNVAAGAYADTIVVTVTY
ncbi:spore coat U domain-containing protein [Fontimonas sp. SYSU GA230001]|uniref:Csu type fimbrial protein n=1 Tax=Fontimonas sp. SYSU GA230001 TaxID=3142450 RepID=UPI0032B549A9